MTQNHQSDDFRFQVVLRIEGRNGRHLLTSGVQAAAWLAVLALRVASLLMGKAF